MKSNYHASSFIPIALVILGYFLNLSYSVGDHGMTIWIYTTDNIGSYLYELILPILLLIFSKMSVSSKVFNTLKIISIVLATVQIVAAVISLTLLAGAANSIFFLYESVLSNLPGNDLFWSFFYFISGYTFIWVLVLSSICVIAVNFVCYVMFKKLEFTAVKNEEEAHKAGQNPVTWEKSYGVIGFVLIFINIGIEVLYYVVGTSGDIEDMIKQKYQC